MYRSLIGLIWRTGMIWRTRIWVLAFSLVFSFPSSPSAKRRRSLPRRMAARVASLLPGIVRGGPWTEPTYADSTDGDSVAGEDMAVRRIAEQALGPYNGSVVIVDSSTGRILSIL